MWHITFNVYGNTFTSYEAYDVNVFIFLGIEIIYNMIHCKDENTLHINQNIKPNNVRKRWYITLIIRWSDTNTCILNTTKKL